MKAYSKMMFLDWWNVLNRELARRGEPEALHGEARDWYDSLPPATCFGVEKKLEERHVNRIINARKPL